MTTSTFLTLAASQPAGGAAIGQIIIATAGAMVVTALLLWLGFGHRSGRSRTSAAPPRSASASSGLPGWAALPSGVATVSLIIALFGMYWDISLHIDVGRDPGPLANPAHYFILLGLFGDLRRRASSRCVLPEEHSRPDRRSASPATGTRPLGGVLICACGAFSLLGFPLDDIWHRLFGQDVTLWGPTHLMLIGGAAMTLIGLAVAARRGHRASTRRDGTRDRSSRAAVVDRAASALTGGLLLGLSTFQARVRLRRAAVPLRLPADADHARRRASALVAARIWAGRGAALGAVGFFLLIRGGLALLVGPILGETTPHFPLYIVEALIVEAVGLCVGRERPLASALLAGVRHRHRRPRGRVGLVARLDAAAVAVGAVPRGRAAGLRDGRRRGAHRRRGPPAAWPATRSPACRCCARAAVGAAARGRGADRVRALQARAAGRERQGRADDVTGRPNRTVNADVRLNPASAGDGAEWLTVTAWQGGGLVVNRLKKIGAGHYRTTQAIPVHGDWKALIRLHKGNTLNGAADLPARGLRDPGQGGPGARPASRGPSPPITRSCSASRRTAAGVLWAIAYTHRRSDRPRAARRCWPGGCTAWRARRAWAGGGEPPAQRAETRPATTPTPATS